MTYKKGNNIIFAVLSFFGWYINNGDFENDLYRDFTYVDDIVEGIEKLINRIPISDSNWNDATGEQCRSSAPYKIYNIGNNQPIKLEKFISVLEKSLGCEAKKKYMEMQPGDVLRTYADVSDLEKEIGFRPSTSIEDGLQKFVEWYRDYYEKEEVVHECH